MKFDLSVRKPTQTGTKQHKYYCGIDLHARSIYLAILILQSLPGIGKTLAMAILYEVPPIDRFKRVQDVLSYSRLVKCQKESAGKKYGSSGAKMGKAYLKWAFSEAAVLFLKGNKRRQAFLARLEKKHGKGKALSILTVKIGRAVYFILLRNHPFDEARFLVC